MAYSFTQAATTVFGNQRVVQGVLAADGASGVVSFGLGTITHVQVTPKSAATVGVRVKINGLAAGTSSAGDLGISGAASGDDFYVTVFGR